MSRKHTDILKPVLAVAAAALLMAATPVPPPQDDAVYMTQTGETQLAPSPTPPAADITAPVANPQPPKKTVKLKPAPSAPLPSVMPSPQLGTEANPLVAQIIPPEKEHSDRPDPHDKPGTHAMLATLFAALLVAVGAMQCVILRRQTIILDKVAEAASITERAYLSVDNFAIFAPNLGLGQTVSYQIWNSGKIPAQTITTLSKYSIGLSIHRVPNYDNAIVSGPAIIRPGAFIKQPIVLNEEITEEQIAHLKTRRMSIFVWGKVVYADSFGHERVTGYCSKLVWQDAGYFAPEIEGGGAYNYFT